jgi:hypothetical protein
LILYLIIGIPDEIRHFSMVLVSNCACKIDYIRPIIIDTIMKKITLVVGLLSMATLLFAQPSATLLTFGGYTFADRFDFNYSSGGIGTGKIQDGFQWGVGLEFEVAPDAAVELIYQNMKADVVFQGVTQQQYTGQTGINYALIGGTRYAPLNDRVSGFGSLDIGAAWTNPEESLDTESVTKFAWGGRLGVRIQTSDKISLRLHAQLLSPVQWAGGGFYFGTGGAGAGVSAGSTIYQFNLGGSVNVKLR